MSAFKKILGKIVSSKKNHKKLSHWFLWFQWGSFGDFLEYERFFQIISNSLIEIKCLNFVSCDSWKKIAHVTCLSVSLACAWLREGFRLPIIRMVVRMWSLSKTIKSVSALFDASTEARVFDPGTTIYIVAGSWSWSASFLKHRGAVLNGKLTV